MDQPFDVMWSPILLFGLLGLFFLQKAVRRGARQSWSWGRGGGPVPLSRWSYGWVAATFLAIALILAHGSRPPIASVVAFLVCFLATLGAGFVDTQRYNKAQRLHGPSRNQRS